MSATFLYDADGNRVKGTVAGVTTVYPSTRLRAGLAGLYEYQNGATTEYYEGGAIRRTGYATENGVFYALSDQLRSTSVLVNQNGTVKSRNFYYPYGGNRGGARSPASRRSGSRGNTTSKVCLAGKGWRSTTRAGTMPS